MEVLLVPPSQIYVHREARQRREISVSDLLPSIQKLGILNPIIVDDQWYLIAGERRLQAAITLGLASVPVRLLSELSPVEREMVELDENLRRQELPWQDKVRAVERLHKLWLSQNPSATLTAFAEHIGYAPTWATQCLDAARQLREGNERVAQAPTLSKAINIVQRQEERQTNQALAEILDTVSISPKIGGASAAPPLQPPEPESIITTSFHRWASEYSGEKFNLIHCDFPYGVNLGESDQIANSGHLVYDDNEDVYWQLLETLAMWEDKFISSSAHIVFWYSMKFHRETLDFFEKRFPSFTFDEMPLVWWKTDNKGIAPDVERRPRRVYETALFGWRGDRRLVRLGSNAYGAPKAQNSSHVSEKPEPVLRHFLSMLVDGSTRLLDPTCGSGSALRAAESLGAGRVLGLELDPSYADDARAKLKSFRALRSVAS